jgi:hypothetical protein
MFKDPEEIAQEMIDSYADDAYSRTLDLVIMTHNINDKEGEQIFSDVAILLMQRGYYKRHKLEEFGSQEPPLHGFSGDSSKEG